ncbi:MAG: 30S ribosomal protein S18 [Lachnospiraceae bacterium]|jgi:small subunit ribosomal protein S18|nr:30S ribosomal protein S18 [Lachnospiraceae bacterium]MBR4313504.1 30S ribosomal protein S18 [Lachnospiraceae bacterium]
MPAEKKQKFYDKEDRKDRKSGFRPRKKRTCQFCTKGAQAISYKDEKTLRKYISERGKILPRRVTGACAKHQREIVNAINRARHVGILPYVIE